MFQGTGSRIKNLVPELWECSQEPKKRVLEQKKSNLEPHNWPKTVLTRFQKYKHVEYHSNLERIDDWQYSPFSYKLIQNKQYLK